MQGDDLPYPLNGTGMHGTSPRMGFARESRATLGALLGAALAHGAVAVLLFGRRAPSPPRLESPPSPAERAEADVDLAASEEVDERAELRSLASRAPAAASANSGARLGAEHRSERTHEDPAPVAAASGEQPPGPLTLLREAAPARIGLALRGPNPFQAVGALPELPGGAVEGPGEPARAGPRAPTNAEAKHNAESVLRAPARDRERELGLGPDGPVLAALTVPTVGMTIIGVNGDPANIGAKPRRVVHTRLLGSQVL